MAGEIPRLSTVLERTLRDLGLDKRVKEEQVVRLWPRLVGPAIAKIATPAHLRHGTLFIEVVDHLWMQELKLQERDLLERLNEALGVRLVRRLFVQRARIPTDALAEPQAEAAAAAPPSAADAPLDAAHERLLEHELAGVRDPGLREALKSFRRRLLQGRPPG
jgi:hypothetical protein